MCACLSPQPPVSSRPPTSSPEKIRRSSYSFSVSPRSPDPRTIVPPPALSSPSLFPPTPPSLSFGRPRLLHGWYSRQTRRGERETEGQRGTTGEDRGKSLCDPRFHFRRRLSDTCAFSLRTIVIVWALPRVKFAQRTDARLIDEQSQVVVLLVSDLGKTIPFREVRKII